MKSEKGILLSVLLFAMIFFSNYAGNQVVTTPTTSKMETSRQESNVEENQQAVAGNLKIAYIDVGQADSIFIILPNGETVLIDAGEQASSDDIIQHIKDSGQNTLDYVIATHPHADHIGGMATVLDAFDVKNIYMPDKVHTSKTFENLIDTIDAKGLSINIAKAGKTIFDYGNIKAAFIAPVGDNYSNLNNYSAVVLLTYNDCRFLFMGDAEAEAETEILEAGYDVTANILKVGHHGSDTSSTDTFIKEVAPQYAIISCGAGNSYGHPDDITLATLDSFNVDVHRTDTEGTVIATCDGENITLETLKTEIQPRSPTVEEEIPVQPMEQDLTVYITRTGKKYHMDGCRYLSKSKIAIPLSEAKNYYGACSVCRPPQ